MMSVPDKTTYGLSCFVLVLYVMVATAGVFVAGLWAYAGLGSGVLLFAAFGMLDKHAPRPEKKLAALALISLAVIALENLQSRWPSVSWHEWLKLVTIFLPLLVLSNPRIQTRLFHPDFIAVLFIAACAGALALSLELDLGGPLLHAMKGANAGLTQYNRGLSYLVILAFPLMAGLMHGRFPLASNKRWLVVVLFICVLLIPAGLTESRAAKLALLMGLVTVAAAYVMPVVTRRALMVLTVLCIGWPFAVQTFFVAHYDMLKRFPDSWHARMEIWDYMSYRILEKPILGWGIGTAHLLPYAQPHGGQYIFGLPASHPHNVMTQLWVELGLPGLALGVVFAVLMLSKAGRLNNKLVPFALGAWMAAFCLSLVAYDFWTDSLFAAFALAGLVFAMLGSSPLEGEEAKT